MSRRTALRLLGIGPRLAGGGGLLYANLSHLDAFRAAVAANAAAGVVPITIIGDSIGEGYESTDFLADGFASIIRDAFQTAYGDAGAGMMTVWRDIDNAGTGIWSFSDTITDSVWFYQLNYGTTGTITISGTGFTFIYLRGSAVGRFTITIDGGAPTEYDAYFASTSMTSLTVTGLSAGDHTIVVQSSESPKKLLCSAIVPHAGNGVRVDNLSHRGWSSNEPNQTYGLVLATQQSPALVIMALMANSYAGQRALATFKSEITAGVNNAVSAGAAVVLFANGLREPVAGSITQQQYVQALYEVAQATGVAFVNWSGIFGYDYDVLTASGYLPVGETTHPNDAGHAHMAAMLTGVLLS